MSEAIDINEDNCVLGDLEIKQLAEGFREYLNIRSRFSTHDDVFEIFTRIFQKITKLNDLAKEARKE